VYEEVYAKVPSIKFVMRSPSWVVLELTLRKNWNQMLSGKRKYVEVFLMTSEAVHLCQHSKDRQGS